MRKPLLIIALSGLLSACVDAPLQPAHLAADGQLHGLMPMEHAIPASASTTPRRVVSFNAVVAAQKQGALEDAVVFPHEIGEVHLHVRADGLDSVRPVTFVWIHDDVREEQEGVLAPASALARVASRKIAADQTGWWRVEVYAEPDEAGTRELLVKREFQVL